jgi:hypothetical protein
VENQESATLGSSLFAAWNVLADTMAALAFPIGHRRTFLPLFWYCHDVHDHHSVSNFYQDLYFTTSGL